MAESTQTSKGKGSAAASVGPATIPPERQFVHLHLHSEYSLLDGGNRIDRLVARVKHLGMNAVAVTDHGNLHGAVAFSAAAKAAGLKPILGVEAYVAPRSRRDREFTGVVDGGYHLVLLAETQAGWRNLLTICSEAYLSGFYFKPRADRELLEAHSEGLIAISGHLGSELAHHLVEYEKTGSEAFYEKAVEAARWHARTFAGLPAGSAGAGNFFVELQHHIDEQNTINRHLIRLARELKLPLVCDNDSHFLQAEDHDTHDTLICISMGKVKSDQNRYHYPRELYVKSPSEMRELFEGVYGDVGREACDNTVRIAERCAADLDLGQNHAPMVRVSIPRPSDLPAHSDPTYAGDLTAWYKDYCSRFALQPFSRASDGAGDLAAVKADCDRALSMLAEAGFIWRYGQAAGSATQANRARLDRELKILADKSISAYFLIVWDFVNWGRQRGIPAIARGSGVGTMVGYVLGLSNACPVRYGLLFERFTDPDRSEYPDIDIDLCQDGRSDVIEYVRSKYGHVAQIITFGTLKARAAVRDVARVLELPLADADKVSKLIPETLNITLDEALSAEPDLKKLYETDDRVRRVIETAKGLEGQARHASVHAAGVIVATRPLHEIVPLYKQSGAADNEIVTQWDGPTCEKVGLLKMDFLGLRTLSVIERARAMIKEGLPEKSIWQAVGRAEEFQRASTESAGKARSERRLRSATQALAHPLDLDRLTFDDQNVLEMFRRADTTGVFQFESGGMRRLLVEMKPDRLEDLIAANALFRPGPMDLIPDYNRRKHGLDAVPQVHPIVDQYTAETYGVMVYQEQIMQIVHGLGGIPLRAAYTLIKAIGKKKEKVIEAERPKFIAGAHERGLDRATAERIFEDILKFAGYGFNKSHSTGYAIVAYQTAYLKTYFPNQYMAAFLTYESGAMKVSEWTPYLEDCRKTRFIDPGTRQTIKVGVEVRPPDINLSASDFSVVFEDDAPFESRTSALGHVRFGLKAIKGAGEKAIAAIISQRDAGGVVRSAPYSSMFDFCERILSRAPTGSGGTVINKATIESLIKCGAFDSVHARDQRAAMIATIESAVLAGQKAAADRAAGQGGLFGGPASGAQAQAAPAPATLARAIPWSEAELLAEEKATLGFFVSSHPLERWKRWASMFTTGTTESVKSLAQDKRAVLAGLVQSVRPLVVRSGRSAGQKMAILTFEDALGAVEAVLFTDCYREFEGLVKPDAVLFMLGRVDRSRGDAQIIVDRLVPIEGVPLMPGRICLHIDSLRLNGSARAVLAGVADILQGAAAPAVLQAAAASEGPAPRFPVDLCIDTERGRTMLEAGLRDTEGVAGGRAGALRVAPTPSLAESIAGLLGENCMKVIGGIAVEVTANGGRGAPYRARQKS